MEVGTGAMRGKNEGKWGEMKKWGNGVQDGEMGEEKVVEKVNTTLREVCYN